MSRPMRVGLTGGIASGKTTVANEFSALGIPVIDADAVARIVVEPGTPGLADVVRRFGEAVLDTRGALDRSKLRAIIFEDAASRRELEAILHPLIRTEMRRQSEAAGGAYQIHAIPLLVESQLMNLVDRVLLIDVTEAVQLLRVMARDGSTEAQARAILAAQATREARRAAADDIISNTGTVADLHQCVTKLDARYLELAKAFNRISS